MLNQQIDTAIKTFVKGMVYEGKRPPTDYVKNDPLYWNQFGWLHSTLAPQNNAPRFAYIRDRILQKLAMFDYEGMGPAVKDVFGIGPEDEGYSMACVELLRCEAQIFDARAGLARGDTTQFDALRAMVSNQPVSLASAVAAQMVKAEADIPHQSNVVAPLEVPPTVPGIKTKLLSEAVKQYVDDKIEGKKWNTKSAYESKCNFDLIVYVVEDGPMDRLDDENFVKEVVTRFKNLPKNVKKYEKYKDKPITEVITMPGIVPISESRVNKYLEYLSVVIDSTFAVGKTV